MRHFNENFRKDVTYDNIKSHTKPGLHPLSRRCIFAKTTGDGGGGGKGAHNDPSSLLSVKKENQNILYIAYILLYVDVLIFFSTELLVKMKL